jgi:hypothetical protein
MKQPRIRIWKVATIGLAIAGLAAPAAQARPLGGGYVTGAYGAPSAIALGPQTSGVGERQLQQQAPGSYKTGAYGAPSAIALGPQTSGVGERQLQQQVAGSYKTGAYGAPSAIALGPQTSGTSHEQSQQRIGASYTTGAYGAPRTIGLGPRTSGETTAGSPVLTTGGDNFDWKDAGIGAASAVAFSILLVGSLMVVRRRDARVAL